MRTPIKYPIRITSAPGTLRQKLRALGVDGDVIQDLYLLPGLTDVHVHLREPGFSYKETIATGSRAAAAGGFTSVITMPNLDPVPDSLEHLDVQRRIIDRDGVIRIRPLGSLTLGEKGKQSSDIEGLAPHVPGFSDDGAGVMDQGLMRELMERVKKTDRIVVAHCEDENYPRHSSEAEYRQLFRDLELVALTGCSYHMCHLSCRESLDLIRQAKKDGLPVTCETAPHYLVLAREELTENDGRFKMNPPIKGRLDREALLEGAADGSIDMIATDHAPHSAEEKAGGFEKSAYGIVGLETAFPVLYTRLVRGGLLSMERLLEMMSTVPAGRFGLGCRRETGEDAGDLSLWQLDTSYEIEPDRFQSKGKSTPFAGMEVFGKCHMTICDGKAVYLSEEMKGACSR